MVEVMYVPNFGNKDVYILTPSQNKTKKWTVITANGKKVNFGAVGYSDLTIHGDENRKSDYINRHSSRENWTKSGIDTAGFWSRWLLWNKPTLEESISDIESQFGIKISTPSKKDLLAYQTQLEGDIPISRK